MKTIYKITNLQDGKMYVGQTKLPIEVRFKHHLYKKSCGVKLHEAMMEFGIDSFKIEPLEICEDAEALKKESEWIKSLNTLYPNGYNSKSGDLKGYSFCDATIDKMKAHHWDVSGSNNPLYGKHHSLESRHKMSEKAKGRKASDEAKRKMRNSSSKRIAVMNITTGKVFGSMTEAEEYYGLSNDTVRKSIKYGWKTKGYSWKLIDKI